MIHSGFPGSIYDFHLFNENSGDVEKYFKEYPTIESPVMLADKGYIGQVQSGSITCLTPKKKPKNSLLGNSDRRNNRNISGQRVIIENYFGRLKQKFHIMSLRFRTERDDFNVYFETCCALTNFEISSCNAPLRKDGSVFYRQLLCNMQRKGEDAIKKAQLKSRTQYSQKLVLSQGSKPPFAPKFH
jgi:hypothetical protein